MKLKESESEGNIITVHCRNGNPINVYYNCIYKFRFFNNNL